MARCRARTRRCVNPDTPPGTSASTTAARPRAARRLVRSGHAACARGQYAMALRHFAKAAAAGDAEAQFQLGLFYARGQGVIGSLGDAVEWFRRAAEQGHAEAQYQLSLGYLHGGHADGGVSDWYAGAAAVDQDVADRNRELMFPNGITVSCDLAEALRWCREAAAQGHAPAQANLALLYARGLGCEIDYAEA